LLAARCSVLERGVRAPDLLEPLRAEHVAVAGVRARVEHGSVVADLALERLQLLERTGRLRGARAVLFATELRSACAST
jgi:hypothetical protein